jgi:hypothetical protein
MPNPKDLVGAKKAPLALVPPLAIVQASAVLALGASKYGPYNWRDYPVEKVTYLEAILRHTLADLDGQNIDPESGQPHAAHIMAGASIILDAAGFDTLVDNRKISGAAVRALAQLDRSNSEGARDASVQRTS